MRHLFLLAALSLLGAGSGSLKIQEASVTWGAGVEPRGPLPPARFEAQVVYRGRKLPAKAEFRAWCVNVRDLQPLEPGATLPIGRFGSNSLESTATAGAGGRWTLQGVWPHAPEADDRLVVEVWSGSRRLGRAAAPLVEHPLPMNAGPSRDPRQE